MRAGPRLTWIGLSLVLSLLLPNAAAAVPMGLHALALRGVVPPPTRSPVPAVSDFHLMPRARPLPAYPRAPLRAGLEGRVKLLGTLTTEGTIADLRCLRCEDDRSGFAAAALQAIARWSYEPVRDAEGSPLSVSILFDVEFRQ